MIKVGLLATLSVLGLVFFIAPDVGALGLKIAPLEYKTTLKKDQKKKGFIDISNPSGQTVRTTITIQAFKQIDNNGGLQFYDDERISNGIRPELREIDLKPREAYRIFFTVDGKRLPPGDVYAAIFFTTQPRQPRSGVGQLVRVGTILSIINQTPGERRAEIARLSVPFLQFTDTIKGAYSVKNLGRPEGGFYPSVSVNSWPGGNARTIESSLVFGGRERTNDFAYQTGLGIHRIEVSYQNSSKSAWVVVLNPGIAIATILVLIVAVVEGVLWHRRKLTRAKRKH